MDILLLGRDTSVTHTVYSMLESNENWQISMHAEWEDDQIETHSLPLKSDFNVLIINLEDFSSSPTELITELKEYFPAISILVIHSYDDELLINPLIQAGALGYLQNGISEEKLFECVRSVAQGKQAIIAEST